MSPDCLHKLHQVLSTQDTVFDLGTDALLREIGNRTNASAFFAMLNQVNFDSPALQENLRTMMHSLGLSDPTMLVDPGYFIGLLGDETADESDDILQAREQYEVESEEHLSQHHLRLYFSSKEAAYYLFHSQDRWLDKPYVLGASRKREDNIHHVMIELTHPRHLQNLLQTMGECLHLTRIEDSTEDIFNASPSHGV